LQSLPSSSFGSASEIWTHILRSWLQRFSEGSHRSGKKVVVMKEFSKRRIAFVRGTFAVAALGAVLSGCAGPMQMAQSNSACQSPWAAAGNNGAKADRPTVVREMSKCS
jgi:hypothetical protein